MTPLSRTVSAALSVFLLRAELIPVRHLAGSEHGFLVLTNSEGRTIASGDLIQTVHGSRVSSRLTFRFRDGSVDDDTTVFTQSGNFRLVSDRHIQKGPSFPQPLDLSINAVSGEVVVRSMDKEGKAKSISEHLDFPPDLANGLLLPIIQNLKPDAPEIKVPMLVATPKPRLIKMAISSRGEDTFSLTGLRHQATHYVLKIELGGITGVVAPLVGKQPPDNHVWVLPGQAPAFLREEGPLYEGGPIWTVELTSPVWKR